MQTINSRLIRETRSKVEFYFTSTPVLISHCFRIFPQVDRVTYLDADLFFYGPASEVFTVQGDASVGIVGHRFPDRLASFRKHGLYNVAWVSFRRDESGSACLRWWRERCLEWCHDFVDQGRFADQGYLDEFPGRFNNVRVLNHPGINAAPWNIENSRLSLTGARLFLGEDPILFYHFQGVREFENGWFDPGLNSYKVVPTLEIRQLIYLPYLRRLNQIAMDLRSKFGLKQATGFKRVGGRTTVRDRWERFKARYLRFWYRRFRGKLLRV